MTDLVIANKQDIVNIADAVRNKNNTTAQMTLGEIVDGINNISVGSGGIDTSDATATSDEIFLNKTAYVNGEKITGTFTIEDEVSTQEDLVTQLATILEGKASNSLDTSDATATASDILSGKTAYVSGNKITGNISSKSATTYTPTTSDQTIASGVYLTGIQTIKGDSNLIADNIKSGVSIFGVNGNYEAQDTPGFEELVITSNGSYNVAKYATVLVNVPSCSSIHTVSTGLINSTAEGTVIYTINTLDGITTTSNPLIYFSITKKYRHPIDIALIVDTPITVLTSGTITMPSAEGYTLETIASGTGYAVYRYIAA